MIFLFFAVFLRGKPLAFAVVSGFFFSLFIQDNPPVQFIQDNSPVQFIQDNSPVQFIQDNSPVKSLAVFSFPLLALGGMGGNAAVFLLLNLRCLSSFMSCGMFPPLLALGCDVMKCLKYLLLLSALYLTVSIVVSIVNAFCIISTTIALFA